MVGSERLLVSRDAVESEGAVDAGDAGDAEDAVDSEDAVGSDILMVGGEQRSREASHKRLRKILGASGLRHQLPAISRGRDWPQSRRVTLVWRSFVIA